MHKAEQPNPKKIADHVCRRDRLYVRISSMQNKYPRYSPKSIGMERAALDGVGRIEGGNDITTSLMNERINSLEHAAFRRQGMAAFDRTRRAAALHEAGHAVVSTFFGKAVKQLEIREKIIQGGRVLGSGGILKPTGAHGNGAVIASLW
jgi:hypothetical protein